VVLVTINAKHVPLNRANLSEMAEAVSADKEPRILERDGKEIAALISIEDLNRLLSRGPTPEDIQRALDAAGAWRDMDTDELVERVYRWRHDSPPSPPPVL
jgi:hypothetical protein